MLYLMSALSEKTDARAPPKHTLSRATTPTAHTHSTKRASMQRERRLVREQLEPRCRAVSMNADQIFHKEFSADLCLSSENKSSEKDFKYLY